MPASPQLAAALRILAALRAAGHQAYLAGGCVRDLLLGRVPADYDIATSATPDIVLAMFPRTFAVGAHFGVVLVASEPENSSEAPAPPQVATEVATFRSDGAYSDGRRPDAVRYTLSAQEDVHRRDFTINGLLLDPSLIAPQLSSENPLNAVVRHAVLDHVGGLADLDAGILRAIGPPALRFEEDQLRLLRAVRFAARFNFSIDPATHAALRALAPRIHAVSRERVRDELTKMLTEGRARRAFELLDETGLLAEVLPEVARMRGVAQPPQFHPEGDVWTHTLMLLEQLGQRDQLEPDTPLTLAWGALLHDVGKPPTFSISDRIRFNGHVEVGVAIAAEICRRFRFSNDDTRQILALVENHMRFADAPRMKASTLKRFFRLDRFSEHLVLHKMDCLAASGNLDYWNFVRERLAATPAEAVRPHPLLTGRELIAAGYKPGALFKEMLHAAEDAQLEGAITTTEEALALIHARFGPAQRRPESSDN
ncbi:MAG TPA: CCA tRNA nucleotidyltransferase [Terracidiphilus sp.]|jgi:poly(A) polymerase|nr:CCA tRNA nucleotidyltransferase [Terracidiphilus sp.]